MIERIKITTKYGYDLTKGGIYEVVDDYGDYVTVIDDAGDRNEVETHDYTIVNERDAVKSVDEYEIF
jgi:hypothetical protein